MSLGLQSIVAQLFPPKRAAHLTEGFFCAEQEGRHLKVHACASPDRACAVTLPFPRLSCAMQVDYNEMRNRGNATKQQAAELRQRAATAMLNLGPPPAPAAKAGPWLDLTPGARFSPRVSTFPAHHDRGRTCLDDVLW